MPWCPRCDEVFPEGPSCPRCRARLVAHGGGVRHAPDPDGFPELRVPRRYRRAFERLSGSRQPSPQRLLVIAVGALLFATGFLFGRVGTPTTSEPALHGLASARPLAPLDVDGYATYLVWSPGDHLASVAAHDVSSGEVIPRGQWSAPNADPGDRTSLVTFGSAVALVVGDEDESFVAVVPAEGIPFGWIPGVEAAWESREALLVRDASGRVRRWTTDARSVTDTLDGTWDHVVQTVSGAVLQSDHLVLRTAHGSRPTIDIPKGAEVLAVTHDGSRALIQRDGLALWDGARTTRVRADGYSALGASFADPGDMAAVTLRDDDGGLFVGIVDASGRMAIKPLTRSVDADCAARPAWDARGRWLYVAPGDGVVYAAEATGGRVERVHARVVGCGIAWYPG